MLRFKVQQRSILMDKLPDLANLAVAGLVFGQFVGGGRFSIHIGFVGVVIWIAVIALALWFAGEEQ